MSSSKRIQKRDISSPTPLFVNLHTDSIDLSLKDPGEQTLVNNTSSPYRIVDASASVGSLQRQELKSIQPPKLSLRQSQSLIQGVAGFRRQLMALSSAAQAFVRELQDVSECLGPGIYV